MPKSHELVCTVKPVIGFQSKLSLNADRKYCRMLQGEHSAILSIFIKLQLVIKIFVLAFFEWLFYTGFTIVIYIYRLTLFILMDTKSNTLHGNIHFVF